MVPGLDSLRVQLVLLVVAALAVAQAISLWLFVDERSLAVRAALGFEAAGRAANVAALLEEAPPRLHPAILKAADSPLVRFELAEAPSVDHADHAGGGDVESRIRGLLGGDETRQILVELHEVERAPSPVAQLSPHAGPQQGHLMGGPHSTIEMKLSIALASGDWLNVGTRFERPPLQWPWTSLASFAITAAVLLIATFWFLMSQITRPLLRLSRAAEQLGRGDAPGPLGLHGPREVRGLTRSFNRMQERISRFVADRTQLLAALGHDLRSPLTAMRIRAEMVEDEETRTSLVASVEEMREMVEATLSFARGAAISEPSKPIDLEQFLQNLQSRMVEDFSLVESGPLLLRMRPKAMRRALRNLIENALRYGGEATVSYNRGARHAEICIADRGPGIPADQLQQVFEPFVRLETSRSHDTGGIGLGLSIARSIVRAQGGEVTLSNRAEGGLLVTVSLPLEAPSAGEALPPT